MGLDIQTNLIFGIELPKETAGLNYDDVIEYFGKNDLPSPLELISFNQPENNESRRWFIGINISRTQIFNTINPKEIQSAMLQFLESRNKLIEGLKLILPQIYLGVSSSW